MAHKTSIVPKKLINPIVSPLLTDMYQISMTYAYFVADRHMTPAVFDLFFRKNPFAGSHTVFAGLQDCMEFVQGFKILPDDLAYLRSIMPYAPEPFFAFMASLDTSQVKLHAMQPGDICFPREPLIRVEGPLALCQMLETTLLNLVNFASLVCTNASRFRLLAPGRELMEFGLRRAQGPDGGMSASRYCFLGGFDATSNVLAGKRYGLPVVGTIAHSFVCSYNSLDELHTTKLTTTDGKELSFLPLVLKYLKELEPSDRTNKGELASFISYAIARPRGFLALIDTYDTLRSGLPNFVAVALALGDCGYKAIGIRLDSGDLVQLSKDVHSKWNEVAAAYDRPAFHGMKVVASDGINEKRLIQFNEQNHEIDSFGIGTNLVTCEAQPALGCVYKLVEIDGKPVIKLSAERAKVSLPACKTSFRLFNANGAPLCDVLTLVDEPAPEAGKPYTTCNAYVSHEAKTEEREVVIVPARVVPLLHTVWDGQKVSFLGPSDLISGRQHVLDQLQTFKHVVDPDTASKPGHPEFAVRVSPRVHTILHTLWARAKL